MLKKTLLAAAVAAVTATPAFADISLSYGGIPVNTTAMVTTTLAQVTRSNVLAFSTSEQQVTATYGVDGDIKENGFLTLELTGGATWNASEVNQWLTTVSTITSPTLADALSNDPIEIELQVAPTTALGGTIVTTGGTLVPTALDGLLKFNNAGAGQYVVEHSIDENGSRLRLAIKQTSGTTNEMVAYTANSALSDADTNARVAALGTVAQTYAALPSTVTGASGFATTQAAYDALTDDVTRISTLRSETLAAATAVSAYLTDLAGSQENLIGAGTVINFNLPEASNAINLSAAGTDVTLKLGAFKSASYSADPKATGTLFKLGPLFELTSTESGKAIALVSDGFLSYSTKDASKTVADDNDVIATGLDLINKTSNQNIQLNKVKLSLTGDMTPFLTDKAGNLLTKVGGNTGWVVNADKTGATASTLTAGVLAGNATLDASARIVSGQTLWNNLGTLYVQPSTNTIAIPSQSISVTASILGTSQETFNDFSDTLENLFIFTRDGMKFDTILTGTTSNNSIHIRDISGVLPAVGGKIYVTVWEYDAHAAGSNATRTVLADRQVLSVTLPSHGAVTLNPATIADQLGITVAPSRQARMVFEVETNQGEVAVKKQDSNGIDIQTGTKGVDAGRVVDFTL